MSGASAVVASKPTNRPQRTGPEPDWPKPNPRARRYTEWAVALHPMPACTRLALRVVLLYMDGEMRLACSASVKTLAARASLSPATMRDLLRDAGDRGLAFAACGWTKVTLDYYDYAEQVRAMWSLARKLTDRWIKSGDRLNAGDNLLLRARRPDLCYDLWPEPCADHEEDETCELCSPESLREGAPRFYWIRDVVDAPQYARPRGAGRSQLAVLKAVAFAVDLLMDDRGRPYRWTTVKELAALAGFDDHVTVRRALKQLERDGWLEISARHGRGGGLLVRLAWPESSRVKGRF
jgi:hypothetical protein